MLRSEFDVAGSTCSFTLDDMGKSVTLSSPDNEIDTKKGIAQCDLFIDEVNKETRLMNKVGCMNAARVNAESCSTTTQQVSPHCIVLYV